MKISILEADPRVSNGQGNDQNVRNRRTLIADSYRPDRDCCFGIHIFLCPTV
jgi:hypothetical protein